MIDETEVGEREAREGHRERERDGELLCRGFGEEVEEGGEEESVCE